MILVQSLALLASATEMADVTEDGILDRILRVEISLDKLGRGERPAGRAELLAKKRASGRMQRPPELVPFLPEGSVKAPESCCILEKSRKISPKFLQNLRFFIKKSATFFSNF